MQWVLNSTGGGAAPLVSLGKQRLRKTGAVPLLNDVCSTAALVISTNEGTPQPRWKATPPDYCIRVSALRYWETAPTCLLHMRQRLV